MIQVCENVDLSRAPLPSSSSSTSLSESTTAAAIDSYGGGGAVSISTTSAVPGCGSSTSSGGGVSYEASTVSTSAATTTTPPPNRPAHSPSPKPTTTATTTTFQAPSLDGSSSLDGQTPPDVKGNFEELCPVCGDKVSGYHYGLLTCESCKGFFKRTVQNKKVYSCVDNRECQIDKSQRKRCPYCRYQKCLNVGMRLEAVREDRMRGGRNKFGPMYKRARAMKQQQRQAQHQAVTPCPLGMDPTGGGEAPGSPVDIKPDPNLLQASLGLGFASPPPPFGNPADLASMAAVMAAEVVSNCGGAEETREGGGGAVPGSCGLLYGHQTPSALNRALPEGPQARESGSGEKMSDTMNSHAPHLPPLPAPHADYQQLGRGGDHHHHPALHSQPQPPPPPLPPPPMLEMAPFLISAEASPEFPHPPPPSQVNVQSATAAAATTTTTPTPPGMDRPVAAAPGYRLSEVVVPPPQVERPTLPPLLCELKANLLEEEEMKRKMLSFLGDTLRQMDHAGQVEQIMHVVCSMVDQLLFLMVEWARDSPFFKEIQVEDQMKLLQHSWSEILILDFVYRQVHGFWGTELVMPHGPRMNLDTLDKLGLSDVRARLFELIKKCTELKVDYSEYMCLKFLILLNPDISGLDNRQYIEQSQEKVQAALLEYCLTFYPHLKDKFGQILVRLPEIRIISIRLEEFLYYRHLNNQVPDQTLLTEMIHSRRK